MSNRAATIFAVAAVISSLCIYATFAQDADNPASGAITIGPPPIRLQQELPGRYQVSAIIDRASAIELIVIDTHTGECWSRDERQDSWRNWGSPANQER